MQILWLEVKEYDSLVECLERKPLATPEEMPKLHALMNMPSPFAEESDVRSNV